MVTGSSALEQEEDGLERLLHHVALAGRVDAHHEGVGGQGAGADADHQATPGQVVEQDQAVGQHEGVVVGQGRDAGAEPDVLGALGHGGDEDLGGGDDLVAGRVVLAEPGLVEAQLVQVLDQLQVALEGQRRVLPDRVERGQEDAELQLLGGVEGGHRCGGSSLRGSVLGARCSGFGGHGVHQDLAVLTGRAQGLEGAGRAGPVDHEVTSRSAPGTPAPRRSRVAANSAPV